MPSLCLDTASLRHGRRQPPANGKVMLVQQRTVIEEAALPIGFGTGDADEVVLDAEVRKKVDLHELLQGRCDFRSKTGAALVLTADVFAKRVDLQVERATMAAVERMQRLRKRLLAQRLSLPPVDRSPLVLTEKRRKPGVQLDRVPAGGIVAHRLLNQLADVGDAVLLDLDHSAHEPDDALVKQGVLAAAGVLIQRLQERIGREEAGVPQRALPRQVRQRLPDAQVFLIELLAGELHEDVLLARERDAIEELAVPAVDRGKERAAQEAVRRAALALRPGGHLHDLAGDDSRSKSLNLLGERGNRRALGFLGFAHARLPLLAE